MSICEQAVVQRGAETWAVAKTEAPIYMADIFLPECGGGVNA